MVNAEMDHSCCNSGGDPSLTSSLLDYHHNKMNLVPWSGEPDDLHALTQGASHRLSARSQRGWIQRQIRIRLGSLFISRRVQCGEQANALGNPVDDKYD